MLHPKFCTLPVGSLHPIDVEAHKTAHLAQLTATLKVELRSLLQMNCGSTFPSNSFFSIHFLRGAVEAPACRSLYLVLYFQGIQLNSPMFYSM